MGLQRMAKSTGYTGKESLLSNLREVYRVNLAVKKNERVLVVIDRRKRKRVDFLRVE